MCFGQPNARVTLYVFFLRYQHGSKHHKPTLRDSGARKQCPLHHIVHPGEDGRQQSGHAHVDLLHQLGGLRLLRRG